MSKNYTQLGLEQRYQIEALIKSGKRQNKIALQLGVDASTISRELKRNIARRGRTSGHYYAASAQRKTDGRHKTKRKHIVFTNDVKTIAEQLLVKEKWSPEFISKAAPPGVKMVSHERIYQWIWECKHGNKRKDKPYKTLYKYLRHGRRKRRRGNRKDSRGIISNRTSIEKRPAIVAKRKRAGDVEIDLMMGKNHKGALLVMTDRSSLHTHLKKLHSKDSREVAAAIVKRLKYSSYAIHTLTFDNDKAFSCHEQITEQLNAAAYFTRPYTSQDKGTVENRIGVIRRFFPKKTDLTFVTNREIKEVQTKLNNRPIRKFNYKTANQVLQQKIALIT